MGKWRAAPGHLVCRDIQHTLSFSLLSSPMKPASCTCPRFCAQLVHEMQSASRVTPDASGVDVEAANAANPGLPPSSLFSFLRAKPSIAGMVVSEFDR